MLKRTLFLGAFLAPGCVAQAAETGDWITTWAASPQPIWSPEFFAPVKLDGSINAPLNVDLAREAGALGGGGGFRDGFERG